ncbi:MAG: TetR family transcriptional regulator [Paenibacillus sp.]|nr:TetR family transcriptional regulator [Paenibacillus sp.]
MTPQTTQEEKTSAQERILLAAEEQFAQNGYAGTRVSDIADKAEVNVALINYYFASKEKLYHGVLDRLFGLWEQHVSEMQWDDDDPEKVFTAYIRKHFEFKCRNLNMVRIFQWESLFNIGIYQHYINRYWEKDVFQKIDVLRRWKRLGRLNEHLNENAILAMIWGMMDRMLLSNGQSMEMFIGMPEESIGSDEMIEACTKAIIEMAVYGAIPRQSEAPAKRKAASIQIVPLDDIPGDNEEYERLLQSIAGAPEIEVVMADPEDPFAEGDHPDDALLLVALSQSGELSPRAAERLATIRAAADNGGLSEKPAAVWVMNGDREAQPMQLHLEQQLGRLGLYPLPRRLEQTAEQFGRRFAQYAKRMQANL